MQYTFRSRLHNSSLRRPVPFCVLRFAFQQQMFSRLKGKTPAVTFLVQVWLQVHYGNFKPQRTMNAAAVLCLRVYSSSDAGAAWQFSSERKAVRCFEVF